jgi:hypothetical protein
VDDNLSKKYFFLKIKLLNNQIKIILYFYTIIYIFLVIFDQFCEMACAFLAFVDYQERLLVNAPVFNDPLGPR